jgi:murein DD-endopeptidase MepM/ murein hydrolase activator NlpD
MNRRTLFSAPLLLWATHAGATQSFLSQGGLVVGRTAPGTRLALDGRALRVSPGGDYAFGFSRDHGESATLTTNGRQERLSIARRQWSVQAISGLPPAQVTPDAAALARINAERDQLGRARAADSVLTGFTESFMRPAEGRISGVFGSQRVLNGQPRQPHFGFDIAAPTGSPLLAVASGRVVLSESFFFFGNLLVIDHGHGINTLYAHLSRRDVTEGELVTRGQRIGATGATGRVTGPHLHFSLSWFQVWLDPQPVLGL